MEHALNPESQPERARVFPIDSEVWCHTVDTFSPLNDARLRLVIAGNARLLPEDDPVRHLAEFNERPELQSGAAEALAVPEREALATAYLAGICLSATALREQTEKQEVPAPEAKVTPGERYLEPPTLSRTKRIGRVLMRRFVDFEGLEREQEIYGVLPQYVGSHRQDSMMGQQDLLTTLLRLGDLNMTWRAAGLAFTRQPELRDSVYEYMLLGIGDALRLHALLYDELEHRVNDLVQYNYRRHFFPDLAFAHDLAVEAFPHSIEVEKADLEADQETWQANLEMLTERKRYGAYSGIIRPPGKKMARTIKAAWNTFVPKGTRIQRVSHFDGGYVLMNPGEDMTLSLAGDQQTLHTYDLHDNDALVMRSKEGTTFALYHPFEVPEATNEELAARSDPTKFPAVELLGLCRLAHYIPLKEKAQLDGEYAEPLQEVVSQLLEVQRQQRYGRFGRIVAERVVLFRDALPATLVSGFLVPVEIMNRLGKIIDMERWQTLVGAIAMGLGIYIGADRLAKRCLLPRPAIEVTPPGASEPPD